MKGLKKILKLIILSLLIINISTLSVIAAPGNVRLEGDANGIMYIPGDEPFLFGPNMIPGDKVSRTMVIDNKYDASYEVFLRAERVSAQEEYDLLNKLELTIYFNEKIIYNGPTSGENGLANNISLGVFNPGDTATLYAEVKLDGPTTGNEYKNKEAEVNWIFTATSNAKPQQLMSLPKTGDDSVFIYGVIAFLAMLLLIINYKFRHRGGNKE